MILTSKKKCGMVCQRTAPDRQRAGREPVLYQQGKAFLHNQRVETSPIMFSSHVLSRALTKEWICPEQLKPKTQEVLSTGIFLACRLTDIIAITAVISNVCLQAN